MDSWTVSLVIFPPLCLGHSQKACHYQIIYCSKHWLLIVFFWSKKQVKSNSPLFSIMTSLSQLYLISPPNLFLFSLHILFSLDLQVFSTLLLLALLPSRVPSSFTSIQLYPLPPDMTQILTYSGITFQLIRLIIFTQFSIFHSLSCFSFWPLGVCIPLTEL